ncbi:MAG: phosphoribosylanthranilate isomerase [Chloroherpetonaceae bacterium]|nr:phosphoribosylanthranilate isomerase [Chloroherpetonaceae bacterium]
MFQVKICGVTNLSDAEHAIECGADAIGFICYAQSPRYISPNNIEPIINALPERIAKVGVFVQHSIPEIQKLLYETGLTHAQFHHHNFFSSDNLFLLRAFKLPILPALRGTSEEIKPIAKKILEQLNCNTFLIDSFSPTAFGGTGDSIPLVDAKKIIYGIKSFEKTCKVILAGGLTPQNVYDLILTLKPDGVDVSSGVEELPGRKSPQKLKAFISEAKRAFYDRI